MNYIFNNLFLLYFFYFNSYFSYFSYFTYSKLSLFILHYSFSVNPYIPSYFFFVNTNCVNCKFFFSNETIQLNK